jgi:hypothetical protein
MQARDLRHGVNSHKTLPGPVLQESYVYLAHSQQNRGFFEWYVRARTPRDLIW